jgi:acyl carrier protein
MSQPGHAELFAAQASFAQQRQWFLEKLEGQSSSTYNIQVGYKFHGRLDVPALERSLVELQRRHEPLRTTIGLQGQDLVQFIESEATIGVERVDFSETAAPDKELQQWIRNESRRPFDPEKGPLLRASLVRLAAEDHVLVLVMDHLICDAWSLRVLHEELVTLYFAFAGNQPHQLSDLPVQYADYAAWQREFLNAEETERQLAFWRRHLAGPPERLALSAAVPATDKRSGQTSTAELPPALMSALDSLTRGEATSLFVGLLAAFSAVLYRYTAQPDQIIGTIVDNRTRQEIEPLIGCFTNTLALRLDVSGPPSFRDLLARTRATWLDAHNNQELPFDVVVRELRPVREAGRQPFFDVMMQFADVDRPAVERDGLRIESLDDGFEPAPLSLLLGVVRRAGKLISFWDYDERLFDADAVRRMQRHYTQLIESAVADPDASVAALPMVTGQERWQLIEEWSTAAAGLGSVLGHPDQAARGISAFVLDGHFNVLPADVPGRLFLAGDLPDCACVDGEDLTGNATLARSTGLDIGTPIRATRHRAYWSADGRLVRPPADGPGSTGPTARPPAADANGTADALFHRAIAEIWAEVLGCEAVGPSDDFFDLGGHSLTAAQVVTRLLSDFGLDVPLDLLFEHSDLESFTVSVLEIEADSENGN